MRFQAKSPRGASVVNLCSAVIITANDESEMEILAKFFRELCKQDLAPFGISEIPIHAAPGDGERPDS